jgi:site-specific recombinase XerD
MSESFTEGPLTLAVAAKMMREAVKDKRYRSTPLGLLVGRFMRWFRNEAGATESTIRDYEAILARMSLSLADREPNAVTIDDLRDVIDLWADREPRTRAKVTSVIRSFWSWAEEEGHVPVSPAARIRRPKVPKKVARVLPGSSDALLLVSTSVPRDRVALGCLLWLGVRRSELAGIQVRDFDLERRQLRVYGKGRKERLLPLRGPILDEVLLYVRAVLPHVGRAPEPDDFLLYPTRKLFGRQGPEGEQRREVVGYPKQQPSPQAVHRWWYARLRAAGLVGEGITAGMNMHRARHSFARDLRRAAGIDAASQALGHSDLSTTLGIYGHLDDSDLERAMETFAEELDRRRGSGMS